MLLPESTNVSTVYKLYLCYSQYSQLSSVLLLNTLFILSIVFGGERWKTNVLMTCFLFPGYVQP